MKNKTGHGKSHNLTSVSSKMYGGKKNISSGLIYSVHYFNYIKEFTPVSDF